MEKQVRWFWRFVMMPLLFGLVGASINFKKIDTSTISKACAIIIAGYSHLKLCYRSVCVQQIAHLPSMRIQCFAMVYPLRTHIMKVQHCIAAYPWSRVCE